MYRVIASAFIVLRVSALLVVHNAFVLYDSVEYRAAPGSPPYPFVSLLGNALRPWTVPLFYAVFPNDFTRVLGQVALSIVAWLVLAGVVATSLRNRWLRWGAFASVLVFGSSFAVIGWDFHILSESLALSLAALTLAAWLRFVRFPTRPSAVAVVAASTLFAFCRPQTIPLFAVVALAGMVWAWRDDDRSVRLLRLSVMAALGLVAVWGFVAIRNIERVSADRPEGVGAFTQNFVFVLQNRIVSDPEIYGWFRDHGMPDASNVHPPGDDGGIQAVLHGFATNEPLKLWVEQHGQTALIRYSIEHPEQYPLTFGKELPGLLVPPRDLAVYNSEAIPGALPAPVEWLVAPTASGPVTPAIPPQVVFVVVFVGAVVLPRRRRLDRTRLTAALGAFAFATAGLYLSWVVSAMEPVRHSIPFSLFLPLSLLVAALTVIDAVLPDRPSDHGEDVAGAADVASQADGAGRPGVAGPDLMIGPDLTIGPDQMVEPDQLLEPSGGVTGSPGTVHGDGGDGGRADIEDDRGALDPAER